MKGRIFIILALTGMLVGSCVGGKMKNDAMGVFESTEVVVSAEANGKVTRFDVEEGQPIVANMVLGLIDTTQLYLQKMQLIANKGVVKSQQTDIPKQIRSLREQVATQKRERDRFANLVKLQAGNQKQVDDIDSQLTVLQSQLVAQMDILSKSNIGVSGQTSSLEIQIMQIEDLIEKSIIKSPISGTVLSKYTELGELAGQGKALFKIADMEHLFLRAYIGSEQLTELLIGQEVRVLTDLGNSDVREYEGIISWISEKAEFTPKTIQTRDERANLVYATKISVKNDGYIKLGMYGEVILY